MVKSFSPPHLPRILRALSGDDACSPLGRAALMLLALVVLFSHLDAGEPEPLHSVVSKSILTTGDWLQMHVIEDPYYNKPPLAFWATAIFLELFGQSTATSRLFSALCAFGVAWTLFALVRVFRGEREALVSATILLLMPDFTSICANGALDGPQLFGMTTLLLGYAAGAVGGRPRWLAAMGFGVAFATMSKTPLVFALLPPLALHAAATGRLGAVLRSPWTWAGGAAAVLIIAPWYVLISRREPRFWDIFVGRQMADRVLGEGEFGVSRRAPLREAAEFFGRMLPWSLLACHAGWLLARGRAVAGPRAGGPASGDRARYGLFLALTGGVLAALTYAVARMTYKYHAPLFPVVAALAGVSIVSLVGEARRAAIPWAIAAIALLAALVAPFVPADLRTRRHDDLLALAAPLQTLVRPDEAVVGHRIKERRILRNPHYACFWYLDRDFVQNDDPAMIASLRPPVLLARPDDAAAGLAALGYVEVARAGRLALLLLPDEYRAARAAGTAIVPPPPSPGEGIAERVVEEGARDRAPRARSDSAGPDSP